MKRFVLLRHDYPQVHWDFLLEAGDGVPCPTWRWDAVPSPGEECGAVRLPDHRAVYLEYEGPVTGGRGEVWRVWTGYYEVIHCDPYRWLLDLIGEWDAGTGRVELRHVEGDRWRVYRFDAVTRPSEVSP